MQTNWVFRRCPAWVRRTMDEYWASRQMRIERLLTHVRPQLRELQIAVDRHDHPRSWEAHAVLRLPTATIRVQASADDHLAVLDQLEDELFIRLNRHVERLRGDWKWKRRERQTQSVRFAFSEVPSMAWAG